MSIQVIHTNNPQFCQNLTAEGFEPIECSFGNQGSVIGPLVMDHHGEHSHLTGVALRAYTENFGARREDPRFVVTGAADADACFCIAALAGLLPHPSRMEEMAKAHPAVRAAMIQNLNDLADLVNRLDTNPIGIRLETEKWGSTVLLWEQTASGEQDAVAFYAGIDRWRAILGSRPPMALLAAVQAGEADRVFIARQAKVENVGKRVALVESDAWGFDVWYADLCPCIFALTPQGNVTVGCPSLEVAESLFGPGWLRNVFPKLGEGWGGRESIGGSPRGAVLTREQALAAAKIAESLLR